MNIVSPSTLTHPTPPALEAAASAALAARTDAASATARFAALASASRDALEQRWRRTQARDRTRSERRVHYLSMEFLMGRALGNALAALGESALAAQWADALEAEPDAALGNGGLGRLAACFLDSFAALGLPAFGYGLRYRYGMFAQQIEAGRQVERPDDWLRAGSPWEIQRPEIAFEVGFGGVVRAEGGRRVWQPAQRVLARACDFVVPSHHDERVATLRQWLAEAVQPPDLAAFSRGEHLAAGQHLLAADSLNWVLYPDDSTPAGRELRLRQEYLLVSASVQDALARHRAEGRSIEHFGRDNVLHLNDTHPALTPAELMRLLLDQHGLAFDAAWHITREACSYTNHTLMPEALETWPLGLLAQLLPRHLEIIYDINQRLLDDVAARYPGDIGRLQRTSLIDERGERRVRMANLAVAASSRVNGVSALHSRLMVDTIFRDFAELAPTRFINVTNGVTPRRWLAQANPALAALIDAQIGPGWRQDLDQLATLAGCSDDATLSRELARIKRANKVRLAARIARDTGLAVDPDSLFDVQSKRIHEYKRQLLNVLQVVARYHAMLADPGRAWTPRTVIFAGKAASAYVAAKQIIQLIHDIGRTINQDPRLAGRLKVVFLPNYSVSLAETIIPAADLSEQISTAGTEASGTGNMKFALNGALTIGTWDGANIEMAEHIGSERLFIFGLRTEQVESLRAVGYDPRLYAEQDKRLGDVIHAINSGHFNPEEPERYRGLMQALLNHDPYLLLADFDSYLRAQAAVDSAYADQRAWHRTALANVAGMGFFSTDRTVAEYWRSVWSKVPA